MAEEEGFHEEVSVGRKDIRKQYYGVENMQTVFL